MLRPSSSRLVALATALGVTVLLGALPGAALAAQTPGEVISDSEGVSQFVPDPSLYQANQLAKNHGGFGAYRDHTTRQIVVRMPKTLAASFTSADVGSVGAPVDVRASRFDGPSIAAIESEVVGLRTKLTGSQAVVSGYDIEQDLFTVRSNAPESVFAAFEAKYNGLVAYTYDNVARMSRHDDSAPHWGGAEFVLNGGIQCTSGYTIRVGSTNYMVTAGHCYLPGSAVYGGTGLYWGTITSRRDFPNTDVELVGGTSYAGDIYVSANASKQVKGYTPGLVGSYPYCVSGAKTGNYCNYTEIAENKSYTDADGTTTGLVELQGAEMYGGDSGSPAYATSSGYAFVLGSLVAGTNFCGTCFVWIEPWYSRVRTLYGASLVTG